MKIHTFTVVVGNKACNMACPYCVSKMTCSAGMKLETQSPNLRNFEIACRFAKMSNVTTVLYTGIGEPCLYPDLIDQYMLWIDQNHKAVFPFQELQTNGILLDPKTKKNIISKARDWYNLGLTLICISVAHWDPIQNNELLGPVENKFDFWRAIDAIHEIGFSARINCTMVKGGIDCDEQLWKLVDECKTHGVAQITVRMVAKPDVLEGSATVGRWVEEHQFDDRWIEGFVQSTGGTHLLDLPHGARVFDWQGQNFCFNTCLTETTNQEDIRQMIYFPDGSLRYSWQHRGARIL